MSAEASNGMSRILVIDDEPIMRDALAAALRRAGHDVGAFAEGRAALDRLAADGAALVVTDLRMPGLDGFAVLDEARRAAPDVPVIVLTAHGQVRDAVAAMKAGAHDFLTKPVDLEELEAAVARAVAAAPEEDEAVWDGLKEVYAAIERVAASDATVLVCGETGTGKEVAARAIHRLSPRCAGPFVAVNCAALSAGLLESELFGHEKGAFTGADHARRGRFELAEGGTLLLDEVSEIGLELQAKLLRVLQERAYERVGSSATRRCNVRIVATTNRDLRGEAAAGRFREDLYWRLNVLPVRLPPLRERRGDIPALVAHFLRRCGSAKRMSPEAMARLESHAWPGNVRELANAVERAVVMAPGEEIAEVALEPSVLPVGEASLREAGDRMILAALERSGGNRERAARELGISSRTLRDRLKKLA